MSSHHVVRENQEPAVLFMDAANCDISVLNQALEWSPLVLASTKSCQYLIDRGIKSDVIFYNTGESVDQIRLNQSDIELIEYKDNLLNDALHFLRKREHKAVYVFSTFEHRLSGILANTTDLTINIFDGGTRWALVQKTISKWFPKEYQITIKGKGIKIYQNNVELKPEDLMPTKTSGLIKFYSKEYFWLGEVFT